MTAYVIERNVELPDREKIGRPASEERVAMMQLEIGDSFLIDQADRVHHARCIASRMGPRRFTILKQRNGWRVWRVA